MSDKANCKNCIHFDEIKRRCCLNDGSWVQKECYFRRNNRKPMGNDVIFKKQGKIIKDLQHQLDQQKAMWNELRSFLDEDKLFEYFAESSVDGYKNCLLSIKNKMQELEQGEKDD